MRSVFAGSGNAVRQPARSASPIATARVCAFICVLSSITKMRDARIPKIVIPAQAKSIGLLNAAEWIPAEACPRMLESGAGMTRVVELSLNSVVSVVRLYNFEVTLQFPIGDCIEPLPPFPLAGRGEVIDEVVAEPVAGELRVPENTRSLDQRARRARNILRALICA